MIERLLAADAALERDEQDVAQRLFSQVADADPRNAIAVVGLARVAARRGNPAAARELAERALAIDPQEAAAHRLLVEIDAAPVALAPDVPASEAPASVAAEAHAPAAPRPDVRPQRGGWRAWLARLFGRR
jgi:hypothetical protein